ncbi:MarR family winged helix-turn-helix transcriptional regulator [Actinocorallia lasiicapitis]
MQTPETSAGPELIAEFERELVVLLRRGRAVSAEMARAVHPELDLHAYGLLARLREAGPLRPSDLAAHFGIGKATAGRQLAELERLGMVRREPDPEDGRAHLLDLTDDGRERLERVRAARQLSLREDLSTWPEEEVRTFVTLLSRFNSRNASRVRHSGRNTYI